MKKHLVRLAMLVVVFLAAFAPAFALQPDEYAVPPVDAVADAAYTAQVPGAEASEPAPPGPGVRLTWKVPGDVAPSMIAGYNVYRSESILGHYDKVNPAPLDALSYDDRGLVRGTRYYYKVTTLFLNGKESEPTEPVGMEAGGAPGTPEHLLPKIEFFTSNAVDSVVYLGQEAVFVLKGGPGLVATFSIPGVAEDVAMDEAEPGSYRGSITVTEFMKVQGAYAAATVTDGFGGKATAKTPASINLIGSPAPTLEGLYAGTLEADRVGLNWPRSGGTEGYHNLYRDDKRVVDTGDLAPLSANMAMSVSAFIDDNVTPGATYYYVLARMDGSGAVSAISENLEVKVPEKARPAGIGSVVEDSEGRTLEPGDRLTVTLKAAPGGKAFFSLGDAVKDMAMPETQPGTYTASHTVRDGDGVFRSRVSASFRDAAEESHFSNSATFVSIKAPRTAVTGVTGAVGEKPVITGITDNVSAVVGISGRLTAGKTVSVTIVGEPGCTGFFNLGDAVWKAPMEEDQAVPGTYTGEYTVRPGDSAGMNPDKIEGEYVTGWLQSKAGVLSDPASTHVPVVIDTTCEISVDLSRETLPADSRSQARVTFTVKDADGEPVADKRLSVMLEPPPRYTGVVGSGGMDQMSVDPLDPAEKGALGRLELDFDDLTDSFGKVSATYTAGFAAKTAMIVARDYATGSVGMGYVTTNISSSVNVTLEDPLAGGALIVAPDEPVYQLEIEVVPDPANPIKVYEGFMLSAVPDTLTADGVSRATIIATLTEGGLPVEGKTILFGVSGAGGRLTKNSAVTDSFGRAQVFYIAGTKAGKALVTATESSTGIYSTKVITLMADAPSRIYAAAYPDTLPADGASTSRIVVELADVNNNPTGDVAVQFSIAGGYDMGTVSVPGAVTDFRGACDFIYTAGTSPGVVTIDINAASEPPSADELEAAIGRVVAPLVYDNYDFTELVVVEWYKHTGEKAGRGEPLALVETPLGNVLVRAPVTGVLESIVTEQGIIVMEGGDIGHMRRDGGVVY